MIAKKDCKENEYQQQQRKRRRYNETAIIVSKIGRNPQSTAPPNLPEGEEQQTHSASLGK
jgi:hypothetical protein